MRNPTRHKLDEAKYFLNKVKSAYACYTRDRNQEKINIIHYNLSAFLSASRSVTFIMQKEYGNYPQFKDWYESKRKEMDNDDGLKFIRDGRNLYLKESVADFGISESMYFATLELKEDAIEIIEIADPSSPVVEFEGLFFSNAGSGMRIDEFCSKQLAKLELIVIECEEKFSMKS